MNLCKLHKNHKKHAKVCKELTLAKQLPSYGKFPLFLENFVCSDDYVKHAPSMESFVENQSILMNIPKDNEEYEDILVTRFLSMPMTFVYSVDEFKIPLSRDFVIHIIGASDTDFIPILWRIVFFKYELLQNLTIIFIGRQMSHVAEYDMDASGPNLPDRNLTVAFHNEKYKNYLKSEKFIRPNLVYCSNLHIHTEKEAETYFVSQKQIFDTWKKLGVPLIYTAGCKDFVKKDFEVLCDYVGRRLNAKIIDKNPFSSLAPQRDLEMESVIYLNKSIIYCDEIFEDCLIDFDEKPPGGQNSMGTKNLDKDFDELSLECLQSVEIIGSKEKIIHILK